MSHEILYSYDANIVMAQAGESVPGLCSVLPAISEQAELSGNADLRKKVDERVSCLCLQQDAFHTFRMLPTVLCYLKEYRLATVPLETDLKGVISFWIDGINRWTRREYWNDPESVLWLHSLDRQGFPGAGNSCSLLLGKMEQDLLETSSRLVSADFPVNTLELLLHWSRYAALAVEIKDYAPSGVLFDVFCRLYEKEFLMCDYVLGSCLEVLAHRCRDERLLRIAREEQSHGLKNRYMDTFTLYRKIHWALGGILPQEEEKNLLHEDIRYYLSTDRMGVGSVARLLMFRCYRHALSLGRDAGRMKQWLI